MKRFYLLSVCLFGVRCSSSSVDLSSVFPTVVEFIKLLLFTPQPPERFHVLHIFHILPCWQSEVETWPLCVSSRFIHAHIGARVCVCACARDKCVCLWFFCIIGDFNTLLKNVGCRILTPPNFQNSEMCVCVCVCVCVENHVYFDHFARTFQSPPSFRTAAAQRERD